MMKYIKVIMLSGIMMGVYWTNVLAQDTIQSQKIKVKYIDVKPDHIQITVQIDDKTGKIDFEKDIASLSSIWCVVEDSIDGKKIPLKDYTVRKNTEKDSVAVAMAFVLDQSNSMGEAFILNSQVILADFVKKKQEADACALLKYDSQIQVIVPLTTSKRDLLRKLHPPVGSSGYGRKSAFIDAATEAIKMLDNAKDYQGKAVIFFTDGQENGSKQSLDSLIALSQKTQIPVYGLDYTDDQYDAYLKRLVEATGGKRLHTSGTSQIYDALRSIYRDIQTGYVIELTPKSYGVHHLTLRLCLPEGSYTTKVVYDNQPETGIPVLLNVYFDYNKWILKPESADALENIYALMHNNPILKIEIRGHTDNVGNSQDNQILSQKRAGEVKIYLINKGINAERISVMGFGDKMPVDSNDTTTGRAKNRRTEFLILSDN